MLTKVCTHCGEKKRTSDDHVFPKCLFVDLSNERPIIVRSCRDCNCKAKEGLLKSFLSLFDERLAKERLSKELLHRQGKGDLRSFLSVCTPDRRRAYADEQVTRLFKKLFQGLRRHLLKDKWTFLSAKDLTLFIMGKDGFRRFIHPLPLLVGGPNKGIPVLQNFENEYGLERRFRDFHYAFIDANVISLKFTRTLHGNELVLFALIEQRENEAPSDAIHATSALNAE